jgi:hypothetical protein
MMATLTWLCPKAVSCAVVADMHLRPVQTHAVLINIHSARAQVLSSAFSSSASERGW